MVNSRDSHFGTWVQVFPKPVLSVPPRARTPEQRIERVSTHNYWTVASLICEIRILAVPPILGQGVSIVFDSKTDRNS